MARKKVESNISYDEDRALFYVYMDYGRDENGKRVKRYVTYPTLPAARRALREFRSEVDTHQQVTPGP